MKPDSNKPSRSKATAAPSRSNASVSALSPSQDISLPENPEPTATSTPVPIWLIVGLGVLFYWAQLYLDRTTAAFHHLVYEPFSNFAQVDALRPKSGPEMLLARGGVVYAQACLLCHQPTGLGTPGQFPPLAGSEWVTASGVDRIIRIVQNGLGGPIEVKGEQWNGQMPAMGEALSDEDVAAVITFIRGSWGNNASAVTPEKVKAVRAEISGRSAAWTGPELLQVPVNAN